jgi:ribosome-associated protein
MLRINETIALDQGEISWEFIRSPGPGGQNVNKLATTARLRFDAAHSPNLPADVRRRLLELGGRRVTKEGILIIEARRYRSQERNRQDALQRLIVLIRSAARIPKQRRKTKPSRALRQKRLQHKKHRSRQKQLRKKVDPES